MKTVKDRVAQHYQNQGKIQQLASLAAVQDMQVTAQERQRNQEAESSWVRRNVFGQKDAASNQDAEPVGDTILGDVTHPTPIVVPQQSNVLPIVLGLALGFGLPAAAGVGALATWAINRPVKQTEFDDQTVQMGLGRIDDVTRRQGGQR